MEDKRVCPICGEPTAKSYGNYQKDGLCVEHSQQKKDGLIYQCEKCGQWHKTGEKCKAKKIFAELPREGFDHCVLCGKETDGVAFCKECYMKYPNHELLAMLNGQTKAEQTNTQDEKDKPCGSEKEQPKYELTCLICGEPSNGYHFCKECWNKYKDKAVDLRISNCTTVEILDGYGNRKIRAKSGVRVRSMPEKVILDHLWDINVRVIYENPVEYTDPKTGKEIELHPDFTLPDYKNLIIEYNGMTTSKYLATKQETKKMYDELGLTVETITSEDIDYLEKAVDHILKKYRK